MAKKRPEEPKKGAPEWQATFADLMNLLLCFFVLLFSMSSVDAQKFDMVVASFSQTFSIFPAGAMMIGDGAMLGNGVSQLPQLDSFIESVGQQAENTPENQQMDDLQSEVQKEGLKESEEMAEKIEEAIAENNMTGDVEMQVTAQYVQLTMKGSLLFNSGSNELKDESKPILKKVGVILERFAEGTIEIEGHTDNVPMSGRRFANNNELSAARALSVFDYMMVETNLEPARIKTSGRGEYVPIADNSTEEGRARNRRVEIRIYNEISSFE